MKIGFDAKRFFLNRTGLGNYSRWLVNSLVQYKSNEIEPILFTPRLGDIQSDIKTILPGFSNFFLWRTRGIIHDLKKEQIQIYHGLSNELPLNIQKTNIKSIVTIHDLIFLQFPEYYQLIDRQIYVNKFKSACIKSDIIITVSHHTAQLINQYWNIPDSKIKVIYQNCNSIFYETAQELITAKISKQYNIKKPFLLNVGEIGGRKNQLNLVKAFINSAHLHNFDLILVGKKGNLWNQVNNEIESSKYQNRIKQIDFLELDELQALYQLSDATIYISKYEGFGIPILESWASGKPVITSNESSLGEIVNKAGIKIDVHSENEIEKAIINISNQTIYQSLKSEISGALLPFQTSGLINEYEKIYTSLI